MAAFEIPADAPDWIRDHMQRYLDSDGADGHLWDASIGGGSGMVPCLLLVTTGRKSGNALTLPLIYGEADGNYIVVASKGGAPSHPAWYLNLDANPAVQIQVLGERMSGTARTASGEERARLWEQMVGVYDPYTAYQARTEREIPVVVIEVDR